MMMDAMDAECNPSDGEKMTCSVRDVCLSDISFSFEESDGPTRSEGWKSTKDSTPSSLSICSHAMAQQCYVFGQHQQEGDSDSTWWRTSLAPHQVISVTSDRDGSIIVAATDEGTISMLRGSDGKVLATRQVSSAEDDDMSLLEPSISWVEGAPDGSDSLLIEASSNSLILVSQIHSKALNEGLPSQVAEAARSMQITAIRLISGEKETSEWAFDLLRAVSGVYLDGQTIRFVTCDADGFLAIYDYNLLDKQACLVKEGLSLACDDDKESVIDYDVGMFPQAFGDKIFILCSAFSGSTTAVYWFDPISLQTACRFEIEQKEESSCSSRPKIMALDTIQTCSPQDTLSVAVAVKLPSSSSPCVKIHIVQLIVEETLGLTVLLKPHILYTVPVKGSVLSLTVASLATPYSFRFKVWSGEASVDDKCAYKEFVPLPECSQRLSSVRRLLELEQFDQVDEMVLASGTQSLVSVVYAEFHPSEVAFKRLQALLSHPTRLRGEQDLGEAQDCLRRLAAGAVSGGDRGLRYLLDASDCVLQSMSTPTLTEMELVLSVIVSTLEGVAQALPAEHVEKVVSKKENLQGRLSAIQFLSSVVGTLGSSLSMSVPCHLIRSPAHLFRLLVREGNFSVAERMWRSELRPFLTGEVVVPPILKLTADVKPRDYVGLLEEVVFSSVSIGDEFIGHLKTWVCHTADLLDERDKNELNLDSAITLLETVDRAIRSLQIAVHSSFATATPFVDRDAPNVRARRSPRVNSSADSDSLVSKETTFFAGSSPFPNGPPLAHRKLSSSFGTFPIPTILELDGMKQGASRLKKKAIREEADDANDDCVEDKLREAYCLRHARLAGLSRQVVTLQSFSQKGGAQFVAKELVAYFSSSAEDHNARFLCFDNKMKPFCNAFAVSYDDALLEYVAERCHGKNVSEQAIEESASIARCCASVTAKSQAALAVLRAALFCEYSPPWLSILSQDAVRWASCDSDLQSEVEEASRLLLIDSIVLRYCGSGARELFRVDNPRHAVRLLDCLAKHIHKETVLSDALSLCDAFTHLSTRDACCSIIQNAMLHGKPDLCASFMNTLYLQDTVLAEKVLAGIVSFAEELLVESSQATRNPSIPDHANFYQRQGQAASQCAYSVIGVFLEHARTLSAVPASEIQCFLRNGSLESLRNDFFRINRLQTEFSIFLSLSELSSSKSIIDATTQLLRPVVDAHFKSQVELLNTKVAIAKRGCSLLIGGSQQDTDDLWVTACTRATILMVRKPNDGQILEFMRDIGMFDGHPTKFSVRGQLSVALALCSEASNMVESENWSEGMYHVAKAASLLRDRALVSSPGEELSNAVSFGGIVDTLVCEMLTMADEGKGEALDFFRQSKQTAVWKQKLPPGLKEKMTGDAISSLEHRPSLHETWYVGDGLLLPPQQALLLSVRFCRDILGGLATGNGGMHLWRFVGERGAHFMALRVLSSSALHITSSFGRASESQIEFVCEELADAVDETNRSLAERSLGGSSKTGITSGLIDSQLAVAFLLSLPVKQAFKVYKSSLPTAIKTRDFERLFQLANIGVVAASIDSNVSAEVFFSIGWKGQQKFLDQCQSLAVRSFWWDMLQFYGVDFDTQQFDYGSEAEADLDVSKNGESSFSVESNYASKLILPLIAGMSKTLQTPDLLRISMLFAESFGLSRDLVIQMHIEFLLSPPDDDRFVGDVRSDLSICESVVRASLRMLQPPVKRSAVLRRCLINLEKSRGADQDYERYSLVLALYHEALIYVVDQDPAIRNIDPAPFESELELIDRRRDALAILSSFFHGKRALERPEFPKFFLPLKVPFQYDTCTFEYPNCGILGNLSNASDCFDPLRPLEDILTNSVDMAGVTTALAPLTISLGLPQGYIHARALMQKFLSLSRNGFHADFPSFENDVVPVFDRIRSPSDRATLAEWCAAQYSNLDEERLKCLDLALQSAMLASTEIEQQRRKASGEDKSLENALETIKRIDSAKAALSDRLRVKAILRADNTKNQGVIAWITEELISQLDSRVQSDPNMSPEKLIDFMLSTGSLLAATTSLHNGMSFSTAQLRQFSVVVHYACKAISEQHSHIHPSRHCSRFARKWLFYGDTVTTEADIQSEDNRSDSQPPLSTELIDVQEDETVNFVMDLTELHRDDDGWGSSGGAGKPNQAEQRFTSEEEPSALKETSQRELSETLCQRAALRVAFVLSFADECDAPPSVENVENSVPGNNQTRAIPSLHTGLLAKLGTQRDSRQDRVFERSRELLRIVFAKSDTSTRLFGSYAAPFGLDEKEAPQTVTFAMRHRALRAVSILCPQEALERVVHEEGFIRGNVTDAVCSLKDSTFGAFVAKEIEEMGLPLPHSDLGQLSSMHYLSYARTLWRHHRDRQRGQRGRLLLLLLEMSLKGETTDAVLINSLLDEMIRSHLPRTLLLASERLASFEIGRVGSTQSLRGPSLESAIATAAKAILSEALHIASLENTEEEDIEASLRTVQRMGKVIKSLAGSNDGQQQLLHFAQTLMDSIHSSTNASFGDRLRSILANCVRCLRPDLRLSLSEEEDSSTSNDEVRHYLEASNACDC